MVCFPALRLYSTIGVWPTSTPSMYTSAPMGSEEIVNRPLAAGACVCWRGGGSRRPSRFVGLPRLVCTGGGELFHVGVALRRFLGERARDGLGEVRRHVLPDAAGPRGGLEDVLVEDGVHRVAAERQLQGEHAVAHDAERILIGAAVHRAA